MEGYWFNSRPIYPAPQYAATFVENHDNPRFLNRCNDRSKFTNAAIFSLLWEGIPVFYYGGEQYYAGGADPNNREPLWDNYNTIFIFFILFNKYFYIEINVEIFYINILEQNYIEFLE